MKNEYFCTDTNNDMTTLDFILLACFIPGIFIGIKKGFLDQLFSLVILVLGIWATFHFSDFVSAWLSGFMTVNPAILKVISFVIIFLAVAIVMRLLCTLLEKIMKLITLGWLNKLLGIVFSCIIIFVLLGMLIMLFNTLNTQFHLVADGVVDGSVVYNFIKDTAYSVFPYMKQWIG